MSAPATGSQRAGKARKKQLADGWRRIPDMQPPDGVAALDALLTAGYAATATGVLTRALVEAAERSAAGKET